MKRWLGSAFCGGVDDSRPVVWVQRFSFHAIADAFVTQEQAQRIQQEVDEQLKQRELQLKVAREQSDNEQSRIAKETSPVLVRHHHHFHDPIGAGALDNAEKGRATAVSTPPRRSSSDFLSFVESPANVYGASTALEDSAARSRHASAVAAARASMSALKAMSQDDRRYDRFSTVGSATATLFPDDSERVVEVDDDTNNNALVRSSNHRGHADPYRHQLLPTNAGGGNLLTPPKSLHFGHPQRDLAVAMRTVDDLQQTSLRLSNLLATERKGADQLRRENMEREEREAKLVEEIDALSADVFCLRAENNASVARLQEARTEARRSTERHNRQ